MENKFFFSRWAIIFTQCPRKAYIVVQLKVHDRLQDAELKLYMPMNQYGIRPSITHIIEC